MVWLFAVTCLDVRAVSSAVSFSSLSNTTSALSLNIMLSLPYYSERVFSKTDKSFACTATNGHSEAIGYGEAPTYELKS
jgi:hypothetical protein